MSHALEVVHSLYDLEVMLIQAVHIQHQVNKANKILSMILRSFEIPDDNTLVYSFTKPWWYLIWKTAIISFILSLKGMGICLEDDWYHDGI